MIKSPVIEPPTLPTEMPTGRAVHQQLKSQIDTLETEHQSFASRIRGAEGDITALTAEREEIYVKLAGVYLPELTAQSVVDTLKEVQATVRECFNEKQKRRATLLAALKDNRTRRAQEQAKLGQLTESIEAKAAERARIEAALAATLRANANYTRARELADASKTPLEQYQARAKAFGDEAKAKSAVYETEALFTYLVKRGYNTEQYSAFAFTRFFDDRVAVAVNFREAKKSYDRLLALPKFIATEITRQQASLDQVVAELQRLENEAAKGSGLDAVIAEGQKLIDKRQATQQSITALDADNAKQGEALQALDNTKDDYHRQALNQLKGFLRGETIVALKERARATAGTDDDRLVARLEAIDDEIGTLKSRTTEMKTQEVAAAEKLSKVNRVESWFTKNDYETSRSQFARGFDAQSALLGFLAGNLTERALQGAFKAQQVFRPEPTYRSSDSYVPSSNGGGSGFGGWGDALGAVVNVAGAVLDIASSSSSSSSWGSSSSGSSDSCSSGGSTTTDSF